MACTTVDRVVALQCGYQGYEWGKPGTTSRVAALIGESDANKRYAELWIGTHPSKPAVLKNNREITLKSVLGSDEGSALLGQKHLAAFGSDVPFLLKVLSIDKALSIQAHPVREHAEKLHAADPKNYPDPNHKPELVVALTPFQALCCFRPLGEVREFVSSIPLLKSLLPNSTSLTGATDKDVLRGALADLYAQPPAAVGDAIDQWAAELKASATEIAEAHRVFLRIQTEFPRDVGCWMVYFLNIVNMTPGDGLFMAPNEPHSYLQGDCVEIMSASDNVVRAGLTPKFKDVTVLLDMLTYNTNALDGVSYTCDKTGAAVQRYEPPAWCTEFSLTAVRLGGATANTAVTLPSASLGIVVSGSVVVEGETLAQGHTFLVPAGLATTGLKVSLAADSSNATIFIGSTR